jgi:hypothetical protein
LERIVLHSTILAWVRYLPDLRLLQIGLCTGKDYEYFDVPADTYSALLAAESKGRYYNLHIRNDFPCQQVKKTTAN